MRYKELDKALLARQVCYYIVKQRNYRNSRLTLQDVSDALSIARSTLIKVFSQEIGMTFSQFVNKQRVIAARHRLIQGNGRFTEEHIAIVSGFGSRQTFIRIYKQTYGELPSETAAKARTSHGSQPLLIP